MSDQLFATVDADRPEKKGGRVVLLLLLLLLLLAAGGYAYAYWSASDRLPRGTVVEDVPVGGMTHDEAVRELRRELRPRARDAMDVRLGGETVTLVPGEAGLAVDHEASVDQVGARRSWDPTWLWDYFTGGDEVEAVVTADDAQLEEALERLAEPAERAPVEGAIEFRGGEPRVTRPENGVALDVGAARDAVLAAYLTDEVPDLELTATEPEVGRDDVARAMDGFANPASSGPVTLTFADARVRLTPQQYLPALSLRARDGELVPRVNRERLFSLVDRHVSGNGVPQDAQIVLRDGRPVVVPAKPGVTYQRDDLVKGFVRAVRAEGGQRTRQVRARVAKPDLTTAEARELGVKEQVSTFTTYYPHAEYRNVNIGRAAEKIDGTLLEPGETFSLNGIVGERTEENGFTEGYIISDGILTKDLGGGVSQVATTAFNAMFFAGLEDVEHKPHSFYIDRYPIGREATVAWGAVDLKFRNDTPHGVLVHATVDPSTVASSGALTVSMYSTKYWDITTSTSERYNFTEEEVRRVDSQECHANDGFGGFDIDVFRYFRRAGSDELVRTEKFHTTYTPSDTVICTHPNPIDNVS